MAINNLRGIQHELNRLDTQKNINLEVRKNYIASCLNSGVKVKQVADILGISLARVYKIMEEVKVNA
jgi:transposase